jgi:hypothetical protein
MSRHDLARIMTAISSSWRASYPCFGDSIQGAFSGKLVTTLQLITFAALLRMPE